MPIAVLIIAIISTVQNFGEPVQLVGRERPNWIVETDRRARRNFLGRNRLHSNSIPEEMGDPKPSASLFIFVRVADIAGDDAMDLSLLAFDRTTQIVGYGVPERLDECGIERASCNLVIYLQGKLLFREHF